MDRFFRTTLIALALAWLLMGSSACARNVYVAFGDSITKGLGDENLANGQGFPPLLSAILPDTDNTVVNAGDAGDTSSDGASKINDVLTNNLEATHFLIQFGTNDALAAPPVSVDDYRGNMRKIIRAVEDAGIRPLLAKVPILYRREWRQLPCDLSSPSTQEVNQSIREYNQVIDELIAEYNLDIAPGQPLTAPDFYSYFESTNIDADGKSVEFHDCVHPNDAGYQAMAQIWAAALGTSMPDSEPQTHVYRYKTAIERITASDSFQPDDHLYLDVGANERWSFEALLWIKTTDASGDFRYLWRGPEGSDVRSNVVAYEGNRIANQANQLLMDTIWSVDYTQAADIQPIYIKGVFSTRETAGRIRLEWCQREPSGTTSVYFPSYLEARRVQ